MLAVKQATNDSPWEGKRIYLSKRKLSVQERLYLVKVGQSKIVKVAQLAKYYYLSEGTLRQWIKRIKDGGS